MRTTGERPEALGHGPLFKTIHPDGTDFHSGSVRWDRIGEIVQHPTSGEPIAGDPATFLSVSTVATDCAGMRWPCRLLTVEPVEGVEVLPRSAVLPTRRGAVAWRVTGERPAHEALGPQGVHVARLIDAVRELTADEVESIAAAGVVAGVATRGAAWETAWVASWVAARCAAWDAARAATWGTAWDAAQALVVADLLTPEHLDALTAPVMAVPALASIINEVRIAHRPGTTLANAPRPGGAA